MHFASFASINFGVVVCLGVVVVLFFHTPEVVRNLVGSVVTDIAFSLMAVILSIVGSSIAWHFRPDGKLRLSVVASAAVGLAMGVVAPVLVLAALQLSRQFGIWAFLLLAVCGSYLIGSYRIYGSLGRKQG